jgi:MoaD family protein
MNHAEKSNPKDFSIQVTVKFVGTLRSILNKREVVEQYPAHTTLKQALHYMAQKFGPRFEEEIVDLGSDRLEPFLVIMINGQNAVRLDGLNTVLRDKDTILIMPPITGGCPSTAQIPQIHLISCVGRLGTVEKFNK